MAFLANVPADVVEQCAVLDELARIGVEPVHALELIEQRQAQSRHLLAVSLVPGAAPRQRDHAATPRLRNLLSDRDFGHVSRYVVQEDTLPQCRFADFDTPDPQPLE